MGKIPPEPWIRQFNYFFLVCTRIQKKTGVRVIPYQMTLGLVPFLLLFSTTAHSTSPKFMADIVNEVRNEEVLVMLKPYHCGLTLSLKDNVTMFFFPAYHSARSRATKGSEILVELTVSEETLFSELPQTCYWVNTLMYDIRENILSL